jgi:hypothetical protein
MALTPEVALTDEGGVQPVAALEPVAPVTGGRAGSPSGLVGRLARIWHVPARRRLLIGWAVFATALSIDIALLGIPYSEDEILIWVTAALFVASLGDLTRWRTGIIRDWIPLYAVLAVYALLRGYASHVIWGPFLTPQIWFDQHLFGGVVPTVQLQRWLFNANDIRPWDYAVWLTYMTHFFTSFVVAGVLWKVAYPRFRRFVPLFVGLTFMGYLTYVFYPAIPPWMASQQGRLPATARLVPIIWDKVGVHGAAAIFTGGSKFDNNIAAVPSLHAAFPLLILLFFWKGAHTWVRALLVFYVLAMAFALVYTSEHFVADEVLGWMYALVAYFAGSALLDRWELRKARKTALGQAPLGDRETATETIDPTPVGVHGMTGQPHTP